MLKKTGKTYKTGLRFRFSEVTFHSPTVFTLVNNILFNKQLMISIKYYKMSPSTDILLFYITDLRSIILFL